MPIECTYSSYNSNPTHQQQQYLEEDDDEEDYIDMEITSFYTAFLHRRSNDFEFSSGPHEPRQIPATSPADELFSNGKLLPLHSHPNYDPNLDPNHDPNYDYSPFSTPLATTPVSGTTPFESCNVSPAESCHVSRELTPADYITTSSSSPSSTINHTKMKPNNWTKKLKLIKRPSIISSKIKASKSYFKSLFGAKSNPPSNKISDHNPSSEDENKKVILPHRKSFSGAFIRPIKAKTVSSESSLSPNSSEVLKRSNSSSSRNLDKGSSVDGAIDHCKQSHSRRSFRPWKNFGAIRFEACLD